MNALALLHTLVLGFGTLSLLAAVLAGVLYLVEHRELKQKRFGKVLSLLPPLEKLDRFAIQTVVIGFVFLTLGMASGLYLAHMEWRGSWTGNPKFLLSIATWIWYALLLVVRKGLGWRGGRFLLLMSMGLLLLLATFLRMMVFA